jgi:hypothetical protein
MKLFGSVTMTKADLETSVNAWLDQNPGIRIVHVGHSSHAGGVLTLSAVFVSVWYEPADGVKTERR